MVPIDYFDVAAATKPNAPALSDGERFFSFSDVERMSHQIALRLQSHKITDMPFAVAVYSPNDYRMLIAMVGIMRAGAAIVPIHAANPVETTLRILCQVNPVCVFYHSAVQSAVSVLRERLQSVRDYICFDTDRFGDPSFDAIAQGHGRYEPTWIDATCNREQPVFYWSTSGSTGEPKVVIDDVVTFERALVFVRAQSNHSRVVSLTVAPLSHGAGPHSFAVLTMTGTVIVPSVFDVAKILSLIESLGVTDAWIPPTALYLLLESPSIRSRDFSSLRDVRMGTAAISATRFREAIEVFGPCISQTYGLIETGFVTVLDAATAAAAARGECPERLSSAGRMAMVNRVAIMDAEGRCLPPGESGEIVVRGRCVKRYLEASQTEESRAFGWHHTGDLGYLDEDGFLYIVGRLKDVVNMAGIKISAPELERFIMELPGVLECAVIARPDPVRGEVPQVVFSRRAGVALAADEVLQHCRQRVGAARAPVRADEWDELPKLPAGKTDKHRIKQILFS